eukprot:TRINITY_DN80952_c0_g2_i1.p2 TRINITY_DN80952_c0_g2~~TRINITY_DN80952_c0_g2_i1.p2  ORF type:complete len:122 (+),score=27.36 TRINITY_DN80952_c0_g2_i1:161-526(+)
MRKYIAESQVREKEVEELRRKLEIETRTLRESEERCQRLESLSTSSASEWHAKTEQSLAAKQSEIDQLQSQYKTCLYEKENYDKELVSLKSQVTELAKLKEEIGRAVQQECRDRSRMPSSA